MIVRNFVAASDHSTAARFWEAQKWPVIPAASLPPTGRVVEKNGKPICFGWLYLTDGDISWLEWIVADPEAHYTDRGKALDALIDSLCLSALRANKPNIFTSSNHPRLIERLKAHKFNVVDRDVFHLIRRMS